MVNRPIKAIAKIERDAQNYFFVKMLYSFSDSEDEPQTVYGIKDEELIDSLITLSHTAFLNFKSNRSIKNKIVVYDTKSWNRLSGFWNDYLEKDRIIAGTKSQAHFTEINYLIQMISCTMEKKKMGEFFVQYKDKQMTSDEFYEFQDQLSL